MRKPGSCLLAVCLLLLSSISSVAFAEEVVFAAENDALILTGPIDIAMAPASVSHEHEFAYYDWQKPYKPDYVSNGGTTHSLRKYYEGVCIHCQTEGTVIVIGALENHDFVYTGQNQHIINEGRHKYFFACSVCGETKPDTYLCPGTGNGDCITMVFPKVYRGITEEE